MSAVTAIQTALSGADDQAKRLTSEGLDRLEAEQPALSRYLAQKLSRSLDDAALSLGHMLSLAVFMAFESFPGTRLISLGTDAVAASDAAFGTDEELRRKDPMDALDSEDIVAIEQPALVAFVNEHIGLTLEAHADSIDVDDVAVVFRAILVEILALSHAVQPPAGYPTGRDPEPMA